MGEALPPFPIASGLGLGFDVPVVSRDLPRTAAEARLDPGMVLAVLANVAGDGTNAVARKEAVLITTDGAETLTSSPCWQRQER